VAQPERFFQGFLPGPTEQEEEYNLRKLRSLTVMAGAAAIAIILAACGTSTSSSPSASAATVPAGLGVTSFDSTFSVMASLRPLTAAGSGLVGVILPDATTSGRYVAFDQPYLTRAFQSAGYTSSQYIISNAGGVDTAELAQATADITQGVKVLIFDPINSAVGTQIQAYAESHGVKTISYDRATFQGTKVYYVSFDNFKVGQLIGQGFKDCVSAWNVPSPKVFTLDGGQDTDPNAISFAQGYNSVIWGNQTTPEPAGTTNSSGYTLIGDQIASKWDNAAGGAVFQTAFTAHRNINATVEANDGLGNAVITVLKNNNVGAKKIPTTGQDATLQGMVNVLQGFQCGSVYKPIYQEAQDAVAMATILRAGLTPPTALLNSTTKPPPNAAGTEQPASLLVPVWVNTSNMATTVIKDSFVDKAALCTAAGAAACTAAGIS
jgi:D-xylose transport system substrate-binding protein